MGSQGIKRRKKRQKLPPVPKMTEGDVDRLFGHFTWNQYSPAGRLERTGFLWRQLARRSGRRDGLTMAGYLVWAIVALPLLAGLIAILVNLFR